MGGQPDVPAPRGEAGVDRTAEAREILLENDRGGHTVPTAKLYPFQWNWDSMFTALGWAEFDAPRAWREIESLFSAQWPTGMVPHIVFWSEESTYFPGPQVWRTGRDAPPTSGISQPPVAATIVRRLAERHGPPRPGLVEAIDRWHRWWHAARDPEGRGVMAVAHPWESGRDNSPDWDGPLEAVDVSAVGSYERRDLDVVDPDMRPHASDYDRYLALVAFGVDCDWDDEAIAASNPFFVADPGVTAILLRAERDLAWLLASAGRDTTAVDERIARMEAGFEGLWNPEAGAYCALDLRTGVGAGTGTSASFLALYAGVDDQADRLLDELESWSQACAYPVPSFDPRHPGFEPRRYWRGPAWCMVNYMIATGLAELGEPGWAERLRAAAHDLTVLSGMAESFDPVTGGPVGGKRFAWTAALWLAWARHGSSS